MITAKCLEGGKVITTEKSVRVDSKPHGLELESEIILALANDLRRIIIKKQPDTVLTHESLTASSYCIAVR